VYARIKFQTLARGQTRRRGRLIPCLPSKAEMQGAARADLRPW